MCPELGDVQTDKCDSEGAHVVVAMFVMLVLTLAVEFHCDSNKDNVVYMVCVCTVPCLCFKRHSLQHHQRR